MLDGVCAMRQKLTITKLVKHQKNRKATKTQALSADACAHAPRAQQTSCRTRSPRRVFGVHACVCVCAALPRKVCITRECVCACGSVCTRAV